MLNPGNAASASSSSSSRGIRPQVYALLALIAVSIVSTSILTTPGSLAANDRSRWATVRALVEDGTYSIGHRARQPDGTYHDVGIVSEVGWRSPDIVLQPDTGRFYSSKPTLLPTLVAGEYWILHRALGLDLQRNRRPVTRMVLMTINVLPFVLYLFVFARLVEQLGTTDWGRLFVFATACFGTFVSGFLGTLNNHTIAAMGALFAVYQCVRLNDDRQPWRFVLAGLFAGWTVSNELPALSLACGLMLWLFRLSPRDTLQLALPSMCLPIGAYLFTQYLAFGSVIPTYAQASWYEFPGSYWLAPEGIDLADENKLVYAANLLVGHTGILSLTPALLLGWIGMARMATDRQARRGAVEDSSARILAWLTMALTAITFLFYVIRTNNYGGWTTGPRWFFWLVPLWLLTMLPEADRWARDRRLRWIAAVLLAVSIGSASYALGRPWRPSWLLAMFRGLGIVSY